MQATESPQTRQVDLLVHASWILSVDANNTVHKDASLAVNGSQIVGICSQQQSPALFSAKQSIDLNGQLLCPGFVNAHGHSAMTLLRGFADDLPLMDWLENHIWPAEGKFVDAEFVEDGSKLAIADMLLGGTTCFTDMYFFPDITAKLAHQYGMRSQIAFPVLEMETSWASNFDEYIEKGLQLADEYKHNGFVDVCFGPHAPYTVSDAPLKQVATLANQLNANIQIHLHETAFEVQESIDTHGVSPLRRIADLGLLTPSLQCVHMTQLDDNDISLLADSGAHVIHCPESNLKLASGFSPVDKLIKAGVNVALGTDGAASNNDLDLLSEMKTAALIGKAVAGDASAVNAHQSLEMATINGAKSMGLEDKIGSLESGKLADIIAIDLGDINCQPVYDPASHIVYATNSHQVTHSWIGGDIHMKDRQLSMIDTLHLTERVKDWATKIKAADAKQ